MTDSAPTPLVSHNTIHTLAALHDDVCPECEQPTAPELTPAQLAHADVEAAAHYLTLAYEAINRAKERVDSSLVAGRLNRSGRFTAGALGVIHLALHNIRGGHHQ